MRRTRGKLALPRPGCPVRVGLRRRDFLYASLHPDLPALRLPVLCKRRARIVAQLMPLAASGIGEEHETSLVDSFEQNEPDGYLSTARSARKRDRLIVRKSRALRVVEPADEFRNRVVAARRHARNHAMRARSTAIRGRNFNPPHVAPSVARNELENDGNEMLANDSRLKQFSGEA